MRTKLPLIAAILGLFLLLMGAGGQWLFKAQGTEKTSIALDGSESAGLLRIPAQLGGDSDGLNLTLEGEGPWDVAYIRSVDAPAWMGASQRLDLVRDGQDLKTKVEGTQSKTTPVHSTDAFAQVAEQRGSTVIRMDKLSAERQYDVLVIPKNGAKLPASVSVSSPESKPQPWALIVMILGLIILIAALIWWFLSRRGSKPLNFDQLDAQRRPALAPVSIAVVLGLTGAPAMVPAQQSQNPSASSAAEGLLEDSTPTVGAKQLSSIVTEVSTSLQKADRSKDAAAFSDRTTGAALTMHKANQQMRAKNPKAEAPAPLSTKIVTSMIPYSKTFPRNVVAVVQEDEKSLPVAMVLEQKSIQDKYRLRSTMSMLPGANFPKPASSTTPQIASWDAKEAAMSPNDSFKSLAKLLDNPNGPQKDVFAETSFQKELRNFQNSVLKSKSSVNAKVSFSNQVDWNELRAMATEDGGMMVFGYVRMLYTATPKQQGGSLDLTGTPYAALAGSTKVKGSLDVGYGESVMMYIPRKDSGEKPTITGVDEELLFAKQR